MSQELLHWTQSVISSLELDEETIAVRCNIAPKQKL